MRKYESVTIQQLGYNFYITERKVKGKSVIIFCGVHFQKGDKSWNSFIKKMFNRWKKEFNVELYRDGKLGIELLLDKRDMILWNLKNEKK